MTLANDLTSKSAVELVALISLREVSPVEVAEAHLSRIDRINPGLNAIVTIASDVIDRARAAEAQLMRGRVGALHGLPVTVKDTIDTKGLRTTSGSRLFADQLPQRDATAVTRLKEAGAIILGKTNTPEMAIPYETVNPVFGRTNNPHALDRTCGGSSGGEAAAIASGLSPAGLGSDLSGSIRVPAHFCGIAGLKPTTGRVPINGHTPASAGSLSLGACIGPMARTVADLALLFGVVADPTQFELTHAERNSSLSSDVAKLRGLGVAWYVDDGVSPVAEEIGRAVESAANALAAHGLKVVGAAPPGVSQGPQLWVDLFAEAARKEIGELYRGREGEAGSQLTHLLQSPRKTGNDFEARIKAAENLAGAILKREKFREELLAWMETNPLILAPVGATVAFEHGATRVEVQGRSISTFRAFSYSQTFNVFGFPSVAVPAGRTVGGLPIGVQIVGRPFEEGRVLAAASIIEAALGGWQEAPRFDQG